jgi:Tfp pilus assembly protein PilV
MQTKPSQSGLTLIEVMLSVIILAGSLTILLTGAARCLAAIKLAKNYQVAQWVLGLGEAENPMLATKECEDWEVTPTELAEGFTFSRQVECDDEDEDGLVVIRSRVTWSSRGHEAFEEVVRYVLLREKQESKTKR